MKLEKTQLGGALKKLTGFFGKNRYLIALLLAGALLITLPTRGGKTGEKTPDAGSAGRQEAVFSVEKEEARLCRILSEIEGAGEVSVLLTVAGCGEEQLATNEEYDGQESETDGGARERRSSGKRTVFTAGSGGGPVTLRYVYPRYVGAVVVAEGAASPTVRLAVTEAVKSATGLGSDKITVLKKG